MLSPSTGTIHETINAEESEDTELQIEFQEVNWNCKSDYSLFVTAKESTKLAPKLHCSCCIKSKNDDKDDHYYTVEDGADAVSQRMDGVAEKLSDKMEIQVRQTVTHQPVLPTPSTKVVKKRRTRIPDRPNVSLSLWSILKNAIGKDLTKIPIPVNFSEPLSMLQRLTEDYEYSEILDSAAKCDNYTEEMCMVAAFTVSSYACCSVRTTKPFNPLLGETFECDRTDDKGWRCINEQVKHHPPTVAQHCEGQGWTMWQDFTMKSKFKGNYLELTPSGIAYLVFKTSGSIYSWRKVNTYVHNLVIGKIWVDNEGDMEILNHKTGDRCSLKYIPQTTFGKEQKKARVKCNWPCLEQAGRDSLDTEWKLIDGKSDPTLKNVTEYGPTKRAWTRKIPVPESEQYYNFTEFACSLNEPEEDVAPTDSRLRPDQRLMEAGRWDEANLEKLRLEEKQRNNRNNSKRGSHESASEYDEASPTWFKREKDPLSDLIIHISKGTYWKHKEVGDWSMCPNIY
ncbi:unnamed protein product [Allacma fusca]|uniref:Oxysterol-binding protein n=1 Tax=Allacma fusca TaxID=39272 RepID=A0A8J2LEY7_9HEXA|nr:unnamed protein product [Allacma fusca]